MDLPTVGYQGFKSMYRMPTTQVNTKDIAETAEYQGLSETQKSALTSTKYRENL